MSFHVCQKKMQALCLELLSVISAHELTVLMCHECHVTQAFVWHLRSGNKQWHFLVSSTLTLVNTITVMENAFVTTFYERCLLLTFEGKQTVEKVITFFFSSRDK